MLEVKQQEIGELLEKLIRLLKINLIYLIELFL
jgi:hypothetical protein